MFRQITIAYFAIAAPSTMLEAYVATYISDESKRGHVVLTFQNFKNFLWKHVFKLRKKQNPWMFSQGGWSASIESCLAYVENISIHNQTVIKMQI